MDQKLFLEKLSEVAEWHWEKHTGHSDSKGRSGDSEDIPTYPKLDRFKPRPCPYQEEKTDCRWKIYKTKYQNYPAMTVRKCEICGALMTDKGKYIAKPQGYNYTKILIEADSTE